MVKSTLIKDKIASLPKWARQHILTLEHQRDHSVRLLEKFMDRATPTQVWTTDYGPTHAPVKSFIQSNAVVMRTEGGHEFDVRLWPDCIAVRAITSLGSGLFVKPVAGNAVEISEDRR